MYLIITQLEQINTSEHDLFTSSDANGKLVIIKEVALHNDDGSLVRYATLNDALLKQLINKQIAI